MFLICKWKGQFLIFLFTRWFWGSPEKTDLEELWNDNLHLCDTGITPLTRPSETRGASCPGWQGGEGPAPESAACRCWRWEDTEQLLLTRASISTFPAQLLLGQNFHQMWLLPANYSCHSFCLLNQPVKFSCQSLKSSKKCSHILPCVSPVLCDLYRSPWICIHLRL